MTTLTAHVVDSDDSGSVVRRTKAGTHAGPWSPAKDLRAASVLGPTVTASQPRRRMLDTVDTPVDGRRRGCPACPRSTPHPEGVAAGARGELTSQRSTQPITPHPRTAVTHQAPLTAPTLIPHLITLQTLDSSLLSVSALTAQLRRVRTPPLFPSLRRPPLRLPLRDVLLLSRRAAARAAGDEPAR